MGLDHRLGDAQQHGAAHLPVVHLILHGQDALAADQGRQLRQGALEENLLDHGGHQTGGALDGLQQHIAREAVGYHHVHSPQGHIPGLHIAGEMEQAQLSSLGQQRIGLLLERRALAGLGADVQKAHLGRGLALDLPGVERAHQGELHQKLRRALGVGAAVDQKRRAGLGGDLRAHGRPANALDPLDHQRRRAEQRAGTARRDKGVAAALGQQPQAHYHGRIRTGAKHRGRVVLHGDHIVGIGHLHPLGQRIQAQRRQAL